MLVLQQGSRKWSVRLNRNCANILVVLQVCARWWWPCKTKQYMLWRRQENEEGGRERRKDKRTSPCNCGNSPRQAGYSSLSSCLYTESCDEPQSSSILPCDPHFSSQLCLLHWLAGGGWRSHSSCMVVREKPVFLVGVNEPGGSHCSLADCTVL